MCCSMSGVCTNIISNLVWTAPSAEIHRYYEWLTKGKDKLPHFTKHKDGRLMLMAGLYDCVTLEGKLLFVYRPCITHFALGQNTPLWTFTVVTTESNAWMLENF